MNLIKKVKPPFLQKLFSEISSTLCKEDQLICGGQKYTSVWAAIIEIICLFWLIYVVYFCPGSSATGNHSSKSSCNMRTLDESRICILCTAHCYRKQPIVGLFLCHISLCFSHSIYVSVRPVNKKSFLQHVEDLCANDNAKFQEEFAVSVCLQLAPVFL